MIDGLYVSCQSKQALVFTNPSKGPLRIAKLVDGQEVDAIQFDAQTTEEIGEYLAINTGDHIAWAIWRLKDIAEHAGDVGVQIAACDAIVRCVTRMAGIG